MTVHLHADYGNAYCGLDASHIPMTYNAAEADCATCLSVAEWLPGADADAEAEKEAERVQWEAEREAEREAQRAAAAEEQRQRDEEAAAWVRIQEDRLAAVEARVGAMFASDSGADEKPAG